MPLALAAVAAPPERVIVSVFVNRVAQGDAIVVRLGHDLYVRARDVARVHFSRVPSTRVIGREVYDSLDSSGIAYSFDPKSFTLDLRYRADSARHLDIALPEPPPYDRNSSATIAFTGTALRGTALQLSEVATLALPGAQTHVGFANGPSGIYRTNVSAEIYDRNENSEILAGDQITESPSISTLPIFGLGVTSGTLVRTSGRRAADERIAGNAVDPTEIEIEVAGAPPIEIGVEPGTFSIEGIPIAARIRAVDEVTNLQVRIVALPPLDPQLLAPGWREGGVAIGTTRTCIYECDAYRGLAAGGYVLLGDSLFFSNGVHAEYVDGRAGAGYDLIDSDERRAVRASAGFGQLDGILLAYEQRAGSLSFGGGYSLDGSPAYNDAGRLVLRARTRAQTANVSYRRLRFAYQLEERGVAGSARTCDLVETLPIRHSALQLDLRDHLMPGGRGGLSLGARLLLALRGGRDTTALGATLGMRQGEASELSSQVDMPSGLEFGADAGGAVRAGYSSNAIELAASQSGMLTVYGAVAFLHGVHLVRETAGGYVVAIGRAGDVIVDSDGRAHAVAKSGTAFPLPAIDRPTALAYRQSNVTVDDDASLSASSVFPSPGAGSLVVIAHRRLFSIIGTIADARWRYGTMTLASGKNSPIGGDGLFYFEGLSSGTYSARVTGAAGSCVATIVVPISNAAQVDLGRVACRSMR